MKPLRLSNVLYVLWLGSLVCPAAAQQWEAGPPMDQPRTGLAVAVLGGQIYLLGGQGAFGNALDTAVRYDPQNGQWFPLPAMDKARVNAAAAVYAGRLFVMGGRDEEGDVLDDVEFYDPNDNRWHSFANLDEKRQGLVAVANDTSIVVAGGSDDDDEILTSIEYYDWAEQEWAVLLTPDSGGGSPAPLALTPRAALAGAGAGERVLFLGGFGPRGPVAVVEGLGPQDALAQLTPLPTARGNLAAAAIGDSVYVFGGLDGTDRVLDDVQRFDLGANTWQPMPRLLIRRQGCAAVALGDVLYVFGGSDDRGRVLDSVESFRILPVATATEEDEAPGSLDFGLEVGFPNPFRATTTIPFVVSQDQRSRSVLLAVYDVLGRPVTVLVDEILAPGRHTVTWDGTDQAGVPVGSGVYVFRLRQGARTADKMITRIR